MSLHLFFFLFKEIESRKTAISFKFKIFKNIYNFYWVGKDKYFHLVKTLIGCENIGLMLGKSCKLIDFGENHNNKSLFFYISKPGFSGVSLGSLINRKKNSNPTKFKDRTRA